MDKMALNWTLIAQLVMFLAAMGILSRFLFKPMLAVLARREELTEKPHEDAEKLKVDAVAARQTVEEQLVRTRRDAEKLRLELLGRATNQERDVLAGARSQAAKINEQTRGELDASIAQVRQRLVAEADELAELLTNKLLEIQR
ncbi:MAG: ATP synthase F0 subunit B [Myxococcales bacterium]|nr:ATP synthase F0 subunit B [Myxococcales bacterium]